MSAFDRVLRYSPFQLASSSSNKKRLAVLAFHGVDDPERFALLMDRVRQNHHPLSVEEVDGIINDRQPLPERSVLITFDDGHRSVLEFGLPILAERGLPGLLFVIPGLLSTETDFWWSAAADLALTAGVIGGESTITESDLLRELKTMPNRARFERLAELETAAGRPPLPRSQLRFEELEVLRDGGIAIGNHTWTHPCLNRCDQETIETEITMAHDSLATALGEPARWFAYPNGDWDPRAENVLSDLGYRLGFMFDHQMADTGGHPLRVSRLRVNSDTSPDRFEIILSGLHPAILRARGRT
jgi:peptidoglycan/xylan/chitin deacetylase (PgdA/CDA1 family)